MRDFQVNRSTPNGQLMLSSLVSSAPRLNLFNGNVHSSFARIRTAERWQVTTTRIPCSGSE